MSSLFVPGSDAQLAELIAAYPLAWVMDGASGIDSTPLPLLAETDADGRVVALFGHFSRANPQVAALTASPRATILFTGPNGYVSARLVSKPGWGPTWNYATLAFETEIAFVPEENDAALERLAAALEQGQSAPWTVDRMGERYERLKQGIIAFRATVTRVRARFKLGQDEDPEVFAEIVRGHEDSALARWMTQTRDA